MLWFRPARFAEKFEHHGKHGLEVDAVRTENPRNWRVLIMEQAEQEGFGADPVAFQIAGLLDRPFKRLHGLAAKGTAPAPSPRLRRCAERRDDRAPREQCRCAAVTSPRKDAPHSQSGVGVAVLLRAPL